ncbi:hypothetical protein [Novipirellula artificiosorum]|uniref:EF-hand domain-containing protein n=1 Tax=Novipirellula artificiosorum TaxID=2528016 RepID=A0A5C6D8M9_9BACT|nr:hypothetical protein [Novipirellula artificiosorum]TWU31209.1 hypothetical protein Poly41_64000 [Novipirellula artificiosorum]
MKAPLLLLAAVALGIPLNSLCLGQNLADTNQLQKWLKQFPAADTNGDGKLSSDEAIAYRNEFLASGPANRWAKTGAVKREFGVDPGWDSRTFPEQAVCHKTPAEIRQIFAEVSSGKQPAVVSYEKPADGALRIVGTGHSFMMPGYKTLPVICKGAGMTQPLYTHVGGGMTGSARYKWEQENGIFQFDGKPVPKLLASIANAPWDAMMFGPYFNDRPAYYSCWFDFCLKYNPEMKFYLSDAWPQLEQLGTKPASEAFFTAEVLDRMGAERRSMYRQTLDPLLNAYPGKVFVLPTSDAMVLAAKHFLRGELPGIEGLHRAIGKKERSLWKDQLGHLGPGLERLEGYVFYATLYGQSPERIEKVIEFGGDASFPNQELDRMFRKIAWQAVAEHPFSGVSDKDGDGVKDSSR